VLTGRLAGRTGEHHAASVPEGTAAQISGLISFSGIRNRSFITSARSTGTRLARRQSQTEEWLTPASFASFPTPPATEMISSTVIRGRLEYPSLTVNAAVGRSNTGRNETCHDRRVIKSQSLGGRLKALRADQPGLSAQEVAVRVGITRATLSGIENGHDNPGYGTFVALADFYRVSLDFLAGRASAQRADVKRLLDAFEALPQDDREFMITICEARVRKHDLLGPAQKTGT
jgi:transcriptional regulator with XRE-family HTH domain